MAQGMNAPLYTTEILRLAASLPDPSALERAGRRAERRSPTCGSRIADGGRSSTATAGSSRCRRQVEACAFGQASAALMGGTPCGRSARRGRRGAGRTSSAGSPATGDDAGSWPGLEALAPARSAQGAARRDPAAVPGLAGGDRGGAVTTPAETAQATTAILESGAIMLGAALVFVTLFRKLRLGATLGYIVAGALIGPQVLGLISDPEAARQRHRNRHRAAAVHRRAGASAEPAVAAAQGHLRARPGAGRAVRAGAQPVHPPRARRLARGGAGDRPAAGLSSTAQVLPMLRSDNELNTPQGERAFSILLFQDLSIVPMITIIAAMSRVPPDPSAPGGWTLALYTVLARSSAWCSSGGCVLNPVVPADRPLRRARAVRRRRPVHGRSPPRR